LLIEFGITFTQGEKALRQAIPSLLEEAENGLPYDLRQSLRLMYEQYKHTCDALVAMDKQLKQLENQQDRCLRLMDLETVGPVTAVGLSIMLGDTCQFASGRNAAACTGVTPLQHSSGGKARIGHIPKRRGDTLRRNLFLGARSVLSKLKHREPRTVKEQWMKSLLERKGLKCASIALANKTVRTAYALLKNGTTYQPEPLEA